MNMKKTGLMALSLVALLPVTSHAFGNPDTWTRGWGQGVSEFVITGKGQSQLLLSCEDEGTRAATITLTDTRGRQVSMDTDTAMQVKIDQQEAVDISESGSRVGENNLDFAWSQLRQGKQVTVSGTGVTPTTFALKGAREVLPEFGTHGCVSKASL
ncbi:hypothetical protein MMK76_003163 [Klebsiella aerogenes]|uniref:hypothetical protein n=3 Tax=Klebsiella aerogenes TaxID=548 RepID=UPI001C8B4E2F|nr:hypothetical protein [Klebsiella aerogenes]EIY5048535.1 hypothetical protein [Klebsiella quasipneumoniae]HDV9908534.1 hypothetical protein [Klebsiella oxytoca]EIY2647796.1 hypothetical protein [Klebsiella aerogenes]EJL5446618.1 hypothetical protein [Klebsiella aerogenes]EKU2765272.1 hypothetical protein [Klebsiella aerogenes]